MSTNIEERNRFHISQRRKALLQQTFYSIIYNCHHCFLFIFYCFFFLVFLFLRACVSLFCILWVVIVNNYWSFLLKLSSFYPFFWNSFSVMCVNTVFGPSDKLSLFAISLFSPHRFVSQQIVFFFTFWLIFFFRIRFIRFCFLDWLQRKFS